MTIVFFNNESGATAMVAPFLSDGLSCDRGCDRAVFVLAHGLELRSSVVLTSQSNERF